jgi:CHASE3 domain sensor protein
LSDIQLDVELLKKDVEEMKLIHGRLDNAISKISDESNSINRMLAVHEEKLSSQEEAIINAENLVEARRMEFNKEIKELHDRITKNSKEQLDAINNLKSELSGRVAVLDKFRWVLIGGSIVIGFIIHKLMNIGITIS